jgi:Glucose / Sorbosone dehydrogenase
MILVKSCEADAWFEKCGSFWVIENQTWIFQVHFTCEPVFAFVLVSLLALLLSARDARADDEEVAKPKYKLGVQLLARHLGNPIDLFSIPGDTSGKRFILEQDGRVLTMDPDNSVNRLVPFMNIQERVVSLRYAFDERGMIGVAFHPKFNENRKLYARYTGSRTKANMCYDESGEIPTDPNGCPDQHSSILSEFTVFAENPDVVDPDSEKVLMRVENPSGKNIGAGLAFGPGELIDRF